MAAAAAETKSKEEKSQSGNRSDPRFPICQEDLLGTIRGGLPEVKA